MLNHDFGLDFKASLCFPVLAWVLPQHVRALAFVLSTQGEVLTLVLILMGETLLKLKEPILQLF